ncbi:MAG: PEP-CTERM sorting domain-containing protein, partial [Tepidisphaeraceae bacterium]
PNLHVYVEYSNETWNTSSGFQQNKQLLAMANAEIAGYAGGVGALNFDGSQNDTNLISRFSAEQTKRVADIFASVYGDSAMLTTVRPVLNWQKGNGNATAYQASKILEGYYDNVNGNYVSNPKPISSYIYAGGADAYYSGTVTSSSTVSSIINSADTSTNGQWSTKVRDIAYATTFGIQPVAYEGGLSLYTSDKSLDALKQAALSDPAMRALVVKNHNVWTGMGGNLLIYYFSSDQVNYAFSDANFSTTTQKLQALDDLKNGVASSAYSVGTAVSRSSKTTITGGQFTLTDSYASPYTGTRSLAVGGSMWMSYLLNVPQAGQFALGMDYSLGLGTGGFKILLGGAELYSSTTLLGTGKAAALSPILLDLPAGVMSLRVLLNNNSPALAVQDFTLTPYPSVVAIPEPATASLLLVGGTLLMGRKRRK